MDTKIVDYIILPIFQDRVNGGITIGHDPWQKSDIGLWAVFVSYDTVKYAISTFSDNPCVTIEEVKEPAFPTTWFTKTQLLSATPDPILGSRNLFYKEDEDSLEELRKQMRVDRLTSMLSEEDIDFIISNIKRFKKVL